MDRSKPFRGDGSDVSGVELVSLSNDTVVQVSENHGEEALLWLMTITSDELDAPLYLVNNNEEIVSNGQKYEPFPFEVILPPDDGGKPQNLVLKTYNLAPELMDVIRKPTEPPQVQIDLVSTADLNFVEKSIGFMTVGAVEYDALEVTFQLKAGSWAGRKTLNNIYNQSEFPALFFALQ